MQRSTFLTLVVSLWAFPLLAEEVEWELTAGFGGHLFPSAMIVSSMMKTEEDAADDTQLGDPLGMVSVEITATEDEQPIEVTVSSSKVIKASTFKGKLATKGETYTISPVLSYDYDRLLESRQATPEDVTVSVKLDGKSIGKKTERTIVRSINDCLYAYENVDGETEDCSYMFAAYVNESHPVVQEILAEALDVTDAKDKNLIEAISGYQGDATEVKKQLEAIYLAIQERGVKYSSITRGSVNDHDKIGSQHVRLLGDSATQAAANCVDGSVLFASVFRKMGLDPYLVTIPGHMFVGVYLDEKHQHHLEIETTMVGSETFAEAVKTGVKERKEAGKKFEDDSEIDYQIIDIEEARAQGIIPIKDSIADAKEKRGE